MAKLLYRLGHGAYRRWPLVMVGWLIAIAAVAGFAATQSKPMSTSFAIPGIPSVEAADKQTELFPGTKNAADQVTGQIVLKAPAGKTLAQQPYKGQVDRLAAELRKTPQLDQKSSRMLMNPVMLAPMQSKQLIGASTKQGTPPAVAKQNAAVLSPLSKDGRIGTMQWTFDVDGPMDVKPASQDYVHDAVHKASANGLEVVSGGQGMQKPIPLGGKSELIGIGIALLILLMTFGSLVAAGMPIVSAVVGVGLGTLVVLGATAFVDVPQTTTALSSMIGLAVGIDYSLFILSRYRAELRHTDDRAHAMGRAIGTAGSAVVFAGLTVIIALSAFSVLGISLLSYMGFGAAGTVFIAVMVALTLLPAFMGMLKGKAFAGSFRKDVDVDEEDHEAVNGSVRLGQGIRKAPWLVAALVVAGLAVLSVPVKDLHLGLPSDATAKTGTEARKSADILAEGFGEGRNAPLIAVVDSRDVKGTPQQKLQTFGAAVKWAAQDPGVANAQVVQVNKTGDGAIVQITPKSGPADEATDDLLVRLQDSRGAVETKTGAAIGVTGVTAIQADVSEMLNDALAPYLAIVVGLAFVLLVLVFRSLVVPLLATLGFLLSVLAALGVTVKLVQDGMWGIFDPQPIMSFMPTLMIGIVFGLAMDYQVFLSTRMREAYAHGMDARDAVIDGFRHSGRVVVAAALIMISVFAAFAFQDDVLIRSIGIALATAVFLDAFLVRMVLIPAVMLMLGKGAWWIPRWLDKILPDVDVEGAQLAKHSPDEQPRDDVADAGARTGQDADTRPTPAVTPVPATGPASRELAPAQSPVRSDASSREVSPAQSPVGGHAAPVTTAPRPRHSTEGSSTPSSTKLGAGVAGLAGLLGIAALLRRRRG